MPQIELTDAAAFRRLADLAMQASSADHKFVSLSDRAGQTTRFAVNRITQNVHSREMQLTFRATFGAREGSASTSDLSDAAIRKAVAEAEAAARAAPEDPEFLPPLEPQTYPGVGTYAKSTAEATPEQLAAMAGGAIERCKAAGMEAAGVAAAYTSSVGIAASSGLLAFEQRTDADFGVTATAPDSTGWARNSLRALDQLDAAALTNRAVEKARAAAQPREIPAGRYTVILEPAAAAGLLGPLWNATRARAYYRNTTALAGKLGERVVDERLTLQNRPDHDRLMGDSFNGEGLPSDRKVWIERGVLRELDYDRWTAKEHDAAPSFGLDAPHLSGGGAAGDSLESLLADTKRGVLVTNFWYIRSVNPQDLTLTGMTRDGVYLVEDGRIVSGLLNFRWHDSPLRSLNALEAFTTPQDAITWERGKMLLPALRIAEFNFSSTTRF